jgi:Fic family protein
VPPAPFAYSHHLVELVARVEAAATRLAGADPDARAALAGPARREAAALSARLDGSPLTAATVAAVDGGDVPHLDAPPASLGVGWARALKLDGMEAQEVAAVEYANLCRLPAVEAELARGALTDPRGTLETLHGVVCEGLVDPEVIGRPRRTEQAIHDGGQGMVLHDAPAPESVEPALADLDGWLRRRTAVLPPAVVAGIAHERLLEVQPFEAGNGRVARAFTRLLLVALGVDPQGAAVLERPLWADATGYYAEVAATVRRRGDLSRWLERHTSALATALEAAADAVDPRPQPELPDRARAAVARIAPGATVSLRRYAEDAGTDLRTARRELLALVRAGQLAEEQGGGGLVFRRPRDDGAGPGGWEPGG